MRLINNKNYSWLFLSVIVLLFSKLLASPTQAVTLSISCGAVGKELELCRSAVSAWSRESGHEVQLVTVPGSTNERLALYQQLLAAGSVDVDIFQIDVIWPAILGRHFIDLKPYTKQVEKQHFPAIVINNTVEGRLLAMPWFTSAGLLYYRKDLLEKYGKTVPETWQELTSIAGEIQQAERQAGNPKMWGYVWQGRAYEGLTCNALEWVASHNGGTIVDPKGNITIDNKRAAAALEKAAEWVGTISPAGTLNYGEEEARGVFQSGNAVFMRNWPYAWALAQTEDSPVRGKVEIASLPKGEPDGRHVATFGGWQLAVSRYSSHPEIAANLVMYLTSSKEQKRRSIEAAYNPTMPELYRDPEVIEASPFIASLYDVLIRSVSRPSAITGIAYNRVSSRFWNGVHGVLAGKQNASMALKRLQRDLERLRRRYRW